MSMHHHNPFISLTPLHDLTMYVNSKERRAEKGRAASIPTNNLQTPAASTLPATPLTQSLSPPTPTPSLLTSLQQDGFVYIPGLLNVNEISTLLSACASVTALASSGSWPHIRTVPKQFPPWPSSPTSAGIWGVQHLLHPSIPYRSTFAAAYFHPTLLAHVCSLLSVPSPASLVMELFNLLVTPTGGSPFSLTWHRDDIRPDLSPEAEAAELAAKSPAGAQLHAQYNIALTPDDSLLVVPGSHRRVRTIEEHVADPRAEYLPGQVTVRLKPGDAVFYDSNILHRGVYRAATKEAGKPKPEGLEDHAQSSSPDGVIGQAATESLTVAKESGGEENKDPRGDETEIDVTNSRYTLHGSVGLVGHGAERARQVLQHGIGNWIDREDATFLDLELSLGLGSGVYDDEVNRTNGEDGDPEKEDGGTAEVAEGMRRRLIEMGRGQGEGKGEEVVFSLEG